MLDWYVEEKYGGGQNGSELTAIEALVSNERQPGLWGAICHFFCPTRCIARISRNGEWASPGHEYILPFLRERLR